MARLLVPFVALVLALMAAGVSAVPHASNASQGVTLALDANVAGNGPRTTGPIDACVSASIGQPVQVDIVLPPPGIPAAGLSGFEFTLFFDSRVLFVMADNSEMLMAQAAGSRIITFADPLPNATSEYTSVAADFGPEGVEPSGSSETGPGVLARLTLIPTAPGASHLVLRQVSLANDASGKILVESGQEATVVVGGSCPAASPSPSGAPAPVSPAGDGNTVAPSPATADATGSPQSTTAPSSEPDGPASLGDTGGPPMAQVDDEQRDQRRAQAQVRGESRRDRGPAEAGEVQRVTEDAQNDWTWPLLAGVLLSVTGGAVLAGVLRRRSGPGGE